jgi:uncharacterized membrane protein
MSLEIALPFWVLVTAKWLHLIATVVWLGGICIMAVIAWPAVRRHIMDSDQWTALQKRFTPWANASLITLWITGFLQMTGDANYDGFLALSSLWAQAIFIKHIAVLGMMVFGFYIQWRIHPALGRLTILAQKRPQEAKQEQDILARQEIRLLRINLVCALAVLFFTAVATAI